MIPVGCTPVNYDIVRGVWLLRNPERQSEFREVRPYSVPTQSVRIGSRWAMVAKWNG